MTKERLAQLATTAALIQADCDHDWKFFEDNVNELDSVVERIKSPLARQAAGLVVVQTYLNCINRMIEEAQENLG